MTNDPTHDDTDEIEQDMAEIDARDPDAPEEIEDLIGEADPGAAAPPPEDIDES